MNFCLNDGGILTPAQDDAAPTILLNQARTTNQNWSETKDPFMPWQSQPLQQQHQQNQPFQQQQYQNQPLARPQWAQGNDQTLPIISLIMGILSLLFTCWCGGFYFGVAALITGYIGFNNVNKNSQVYGGKGMAIAGLILGAVSLLVAVLFVLFAIIGNIH
ncbi:MAG TPA: DUF4190 domain-containing protein [Pyrinomonadaceae bacterium]